MGWNDFYRRRDALDGVIERGELATSDVFATTDEVLQALQHRWSLRLAGRVELASVAEDPVDAVGAAWRATAAENPGLRRLLDEHADGPVLRGVTLAEQRMLAIAAGLAGPGDSPDEQAAIGAAFLALLRNALPHDGSARRCDPVERFLRRLVPSG